MNIIEAIKSGRPIRRRDRATWNRYDPLSKSTATYITDPSQDQWMDPKFYLETVGVCRDDLLSDQWDVKEPAVTITASQFWEAVNVATHVAVGQDLELDRLGITKLARRLGLEAK